MTGGGGGSTAGSLAGSRTDYSPEYGGKPVVPSPVGSARSAITGNLGNLGAIYQLSSGVNRQSQADLLAQYGQAGVDVPAIEATSARNIQDLQHGVIPRDVVDRLIQSAAERGVATGSPGSANANAAYLRALGLTSLDLMGRGFAEGQQLIAGTPRAPLFRPESMMVSPDEIQQAQMAANLYAAAPVPSAAAENQLRIAGAGTGASGFTPTMPISPTIRGGTPPGTDALGFPIPNMTDSGYPTMPIYGPGGSQGQYYNEPTPDVYSRWNQLASSWAPSQEDIYNLGLTPAIEDTGYMNEEDYYQ